MKIAIIADKFPGLSETFILNHITGLIDAGHQVFIFARSPESNTKVHPDFYKYLLSKKTFYLPYQERGLEQLVHFPRSLFSSWGHPGVIQSLNIFRYGLGALRLRTFYGLEYFRNVSFDIIHCHYAQIGWAFLSLKDIVRAPYITSFHGEDFQRFGRWGKLIFSKLFRLGDSIIANSNYTQNCLIKIGCPENKIIQIPAVVNDFPLKICHNILTSNPVRILTVARLEIDKGLQHAIEAIKILRDLKYNVRYKIIGDGSEREHLKSLAKNLNIIDVIDFTGWLDQGEVFKEYRESDIFVLPSVPSNKNIETQGLVIQEAQLHGLPVVASQLGGIPQSLNNGAAGLLFNAGQSDKLAGKLRMLIDNPDIARAFAKKGMDFCHENYSKNSTIKRLESLYRQLLAVRSENTI